MEAASTPVPALRVPRVEPSLKAGLAVAIGYTVVFYGLMVALGPGYDEIVKTADDVWTGAVIPLAAGSVYLVAVISYLRWDGIFADRGRLSMTKLMWAAPILMLLGAILRFFGVSFGDISAEHVVAIVCAGVLVGFAEETVFRGVLLRGLRSQQRPEVHVILISSALFGLFHLSNWAAGAPLGGTLGQVVLAALSGSVLYMARRGTGLLVAGMVLHGLWDMSTFLAGINEDSGVLILLPMVMLAVALIFVIVSVVRLSRPENRETMTSAGPVSLP
jgi:membrane protease YdiL (CAAX protease family)